MISSCVRCIPLWFPSLGNTSFNVLCHAGAVLNGLSGPVAMSAPIQISAAWFPPNERTRATSIGQMFNALGVGVSYLLGRFLVSTDDDVSDDESDETSITALLSVYSGVSLFLLTASLLYYPSKPVSPPSVSAGEERTGISSSWRQLIRSKSVSCIIIIMYHHHHVFMLQELLAGHNVLRIVPGSGADVAEHHGHQLCQSAGHV